MDIEQALMTYLLAQSGIKALVGQRIYYIEAIQSTAKPYIAVQKIDSPRDYDHDGESGIAYPRFQLSIFGTTYSSCKSVEAAVKIALSGYSGTMGGEGGVQVGAVFYVDETDLERGDTGLYGVACDFIIQHKE